MIEDVKRWDTGVYGIQYMQQDPNGAFVEYEDYQALLAENERLRAEVEALRYSNGTNATCAFGFHWAKIEGEWEVIQVDGEVFYRAGSDVVVSRSGDGWVEFGMPLDVEGITGPIEPPSTRAALDQEGGNG